MIELGRFALNRAVFPRLDIAGFFELTSRLGIHKVELRNDFSPEIIDGRPPQEIKALAQKHDIKILTINRFPDFNHATRQPELVGEMKEMLQLSAAIGCEAIILVPTRSNSDPRSHEQILDDTVRALKTFQPYFEENKVLGYIEPLGFADCSIKSPIDAMKAIRESGMRSNYRIVYDTFHHFIGPDTDETIEKQYDVTYTGLVHVSGVASGVPPAEYTDAYRELVGPDDKMGNVSQLALLEKLGYRGNIAFEPFSTKVHDLDVQGIEEAIRQSVQFIQNSTDRPAGVSR